MIRTVKTLLVAEIAAFATHPVKADRTPSSDTGSRNRAGTFGISPASGTRPCTLVLPRNGCSPHRGHDLPVISASGRSAAANYRMRGCAAKPIAQKEFIAALAPGKGSAPHRAGPQAQYPNLGHFLGGKRFQVGFLDSQFSINAYITV